MNPRPDKLKLFDKLALILATTQEPETAMLAWQAMRFMVPPKLHLFSVKPRFEHPTEREIMNDQIGRMLDTGAKYSAIAQQLGIDWRTVKKKRDWWFGLSDDERQANRERWQRQDQQAEQSVEQARHRLLQKRLWAPVLLDDEDDDA